MNDSLEDRSVTLTLIGDFFCSKEFNYQERKRITDYLSDAPNPILNFEGAVESDSAITKSVRLTSDPDVVPLLRDCAVALSNNHVLDFQKEGLDLLVSKLNKSSIPFFGINSNSKIIDNFKILEFDGVRVCFMGFGAANEECIPPKINSPGVLDFDSKNLEASFEALDHEVFDYLIVYAHIGYEFEKYPLPLHVGLCRRSIDLGADLVYCSHTHCLQPYEVYDGKYIFYGLGNFYFSSGRDRYPVSSDVGAIVKIALSCNSREVRLVDVEKIEYERPSPGFEISLFEGFQKEWKLDFTSLEKYSQNYSLIRTRKINPRPILYYNRPILNFLKYRVWKLVVDITGALEIRQIVKRILGWQ